MSLTQSCRFLLRLPVKTGLMILSCLWFLSGVAGQQRQYLNPLTTEDGLSQSTNVFIHHASTGMVFIGSMDGLNIFDGQKLTIYREGDAAAKGMLGTNNQSPFFETPDGGVWFGTGSGLNRFDQHTGQFSAWLLGAKSAGQSKLHRPFHLEQERFLWVQTQDGYFRLDTKDPASFKQLAPLTTSSGVAPVAITDPTGKVLAIASGQSREGRGLEYSKLDVDGALGSQEILLEYFLQGLDTVWLNIHQLMPDAADPEKLWILRSGGLISYFPNQEKEPQYFSYTGETGTRFWHMLLQGKRYIWLLTADAHIVKFDTRTSTFLPSTWQLFDREDRQPITTAHQLYLDNLGIIWVSVIGKGVYFGSIDFPVIRQPLAGAVGAENFSSVRCILANDTNGVFLKDRRYQLIWTDENGKVTNRKALPRGAQLLQQRPSGNLLYQVGAGIYQNDELIQSLPPWMDQVSVADVGMMGEQQFLLSAGDSLLMLDVGESKSTSTVAAPVDQIRKLFVVDRNSLYLNNSQGDLLVYEISATSPLTLGGQVAAFSNLGVINHFYFDTKRRQLYVASSRGLFQIDQDSKKISLHNEASGLPNQYIYAVADAGGCNFWLSSNRGIFHFDPCTGRTDPTRQLTYRDGLSANEFLPAAGLCRPDGNCWFASNAGIDRFNAAEVNKPPTANAPLLTELRIFDKPWQSDSLINYVHQVALGYRQNSLSFRLAPGSYADPAATRYRVFLSSDERTDTTYLGTQNSISFSSLPPGDYSIAFSAAGGNGIWSAVDRWLPIYIKPPIWQTWWFKTGVLLLVLAIVSLVTAFYYRYQLRIQEAQMERERRTADHERMVREKERSLEQQRKRLANELHDDLGTGLSTLKYISLKLRRLKDAAEVAVMGNKIQGLTEGLDENLRDIFWASNDELDLLSDLIAKLRTHFARTLDNHDMDYRMNPPQTIADRATGSEFRHHSLRMLKEVLNNILKYAGAASVDLTLEVTPHDRLVINLQDNGGGFDPAQSQLRRGGNGIASLKSRAEELKGSIRWEIRAEGGTSTTIDLPLPQLEM